MQITLTVISGQRAQLGRAATASFGESGGTIGRSKANDWVLQDPSKFMSSRHATIEYRDGDFQIVDTSTNGTYLNDAAQPIGRGRRAKLKHGDRLRLGEFQIQVAIPPMVPKTMGARSTGGDLLDHDDLSKDPLSYLPAASDGASGRGRGLPPLPGAGGGERADRLIPGGLGEGSVLPDESTDDDQLDGLVPSAFSDEADGRRPPAVPGDGGLDAADGLDDLLDGFGGKAAPATQRGRGATPAGGIPDDLFDDDDHGQTTGRPSPAPAGRPGQGRAPGGLPADVFDDEDPLAGLGGGAGPAAPSRADPGPFGRPPMPAGAPRAADALGDEPFMPPGMPPGRPPQKAGGIPDDILGDEPFPTPGKPAAAGRAGAALRPSAPSPSAGGIPDDILGDEPFMPPGGPAPAPGPRAAAPRAAGGIPDDILGDEPFMPPGEPAPAVEPAQAAAPPAAGGIPDDILGDEPFLPPGKPAPAAGPARAAAPPATGGIPDDILGDEPFLPPGKPAPAAEPARAAAPSAEGGIPDDILGDEPFLPPGKPAQAAGPARAAAPSAEGGIPDDILGDEPFMPPGEPAPAAGPAQAATPLAEDGIPDDILGDEPFMPPGKPAPAAGPADTKAPPAAGGIPDDILGDDPLLPRDKPAPAEGAAPPATDDIPDDILGDEPFLPPGEPAPTAGPADTKAPPAAGGIPDDVLGDEPFLPPGKPAPAAGRAETKAPPAAGGIPDDILGDEPFLPPGKPAPSAGRADTKAPPSAGGIPDDVLGDEPFMPPGKAAPAAGRSGTTSPRDAGGIPDDILGDEPFLPPPLPGGTGRAGPRGAAPSEDEDPLGPAAPPPMSRRPLSPAPASTPGTRPVEARSTPPRPAATADPLSTAPAAVPTGRGRLEIPEDGFDLDDGTESGGESDPLGGLPRHAGAPAAAPRTVPAEDAGLGPSQGPGMPLPDARAPREEPAAPAQREDDSLLRDLVTLDTGRDGGGLQPVARAGDTQARGDSPPPRGAPPRRAHPASAAGPRSSDSVQAFWEGLGVDRPDLAGDAMVPVMYEAGAALAEAAHGIVGLLRARRALKSEFRMAQTMVQPAANNALKFSATGDEALSRMLSRRESGYVPLNDAVQEGFEDIQAHELATMQGMQAALKAVIARFDPRRLEERFAAGGQRKGLFGGGKGRNWDMYVAAYGDMADEAADTFNDLFADAFVKSYEEHMSRVRAERRRQ